MIFSITNALYNYFGKNLNMIFTSKNLTFTPKQPIMYNTTTLNRAFTFFVLGNLKPGANGPTAAATNKHADERFVGVDPWEFPLPPLSQTGLNKLGFVTDDAWGVVGADTG